MKYKKMVPTLAVALGLAAGIAGVDQQANAQDGLFGMTEFSGNGQLIAEHHDKCGKDKCGKDHKCGSDKCGGDKCGKDKCGKDHKCGSDKCGKDACGSHK